jgi:hypothetical protein
MTPLAGRGPTLGGAIRSAASDFFFNSWRLVPANLLCGVVLAAVIIVWMSVGTLPAIAVLPLLALPFAGLSRMAGFIVRGEDVVLSDAWSAWRTTWVPALGLGVGLTIAVVVFGSNVVVGLTSGTLAGFALATLAGWGLVATWVFAVTAWPVLMDPSRSAMPVRARLRLAALVGLAFPLRIGLFSLLLAVFLALSTVAFASILTVSLAFIAVLAGRYVLPAADRLASP